MSNETQTRTINIKIDSQNKSELKAIADSMGLLNTRIKGVAKDMNLLARANQVYMSTLSFAAFGIGITSVIKMSDSMQLLTSRIEVLTGVAGTGLTTMRDLAVVANANGASLEDTAVIYNRLGQSLQDIGIRGDALIGVTNILQETFRISGASASEMTGAIIQLSQGLASGQVRGQELRSVLESNAVIGDLLAKQFGTTRGQLLKYSEAVGGLNSTGVIQALINGSEDLRKKSEKLGLTLSQSLTVAINKLSVSWNEFNKKTELTKSIGDGMIYLANNLSTLSIALGSLIGAGYIFKLSMEIGSLGVAIQYLFAYLTGASTAGAVASLTALGASAGSIGILAAGIYSVTYALTDMDGWTLQVEKGWIRLGMIALESVQAYRQLFTLTNSDESVRIEKERVNVLAAYKSRLDEVLRLEKEREDISKDPSYFDKQVKLSNSKSLADTFISLNAAIRQGSISLDEYTKRWKKLQESDVIKDFASGKLSVSEKNQRIHEIWFGKDVKEKTKSFVQETRGELAKLNDAYMKTGDSAAYALGLKDFKMDTARRAFEAGRMDLVAYQKAINDVKISQLVDELNSGAISLSTFNSLIDQNKIEVLNEQFKTGQISLIEYNSQLVEINRNISSLTDLGDTFLLGFQDGFQKYSDSIGTMAKDISSSVQGMFRQMEDDLVKWVKTGKFNTADLANYIIDEMIRIAVRQAIIRPLMQGLGSMMGGYAGTIGQSISTSAYQPSNLTYAAQGTVLNAPTFIQSGSRNIVAGEAGPEAILPLTRGGDGALGVTANVTPVTVNIVNNSNGQVDSKESTGPNGERIIDILIAEKVKSGISGGAFDKQFSQAFGLKRQGV